MKAFQEMKFEALAPDLLRSEMKQNGYLLIRNLIPPAIIRSVLTDVTEILWNAHWLKTEADPLERLPEPGAAYGDPDPIFKKVYQQVFNLESFHALPHRPELRRVMHILAGEQVLVHPKPIGRLIFPCCERLMVHAHQDYEFMQGDPEFFTVWIPLHDCPLDAGPLRILEGSHRFGVQKHQRENLHVPEIPITSALGDQWAEGQINAGDVLIFHSLTVHGAAPNVSKQMRLSLDCRFQDARRTLHPSNLVFSGESGKSWEKTYTNWRSNDLQFYWKKLSLNLKPSKEELMQRAEMEPSIQVKARYMRMISQLD